MENQKRYKQYLLIGVAGNLLCWVGDILLGGSSGFAVEPTWLDTPLWKFSFSGILGSVAMIFVLVGFFGLYKILQPTTPKTSKCILLSGLAACIPGAVFHFLCTSAAWFYARMGGTAEIENAVTDFFMSHMFIIVLSFLGIMAASLMLLMCIVCGKTQFPKWAAVFNILTIQIIAGLVSPLFTLIGASNLGGVLMFGGLYFMMLKNERTD